MKSIQAAWWFKTRLNFLLFEMLVSRNKTKWAKEDLFLPTEQETKLHILSNVSKELILLRRRCLIHSGYS